MRLKYTGLAQSDLERIVDHLRHEVDPVMAADQLLRVRHVANRLIDYPGIGPAIDGESTRTLRMRGTPYSLVYAINGNEVRILRLFHGARNWRTTPS